MTTTYSKRNNYDDSIGNSLEVLKSVTEPNRIRVLNVLLNEDICVCELATKLGISHNLLSFHLKNLHTTGILSKRRYGNQIFYFINPGWRKRVRYFFQFLEID